MDMELYCNGKTIENSTWDNIESVFEELKVEADFALTKMLWPETGPIRLTVQSEDGNYMPMMGVVETPPRVFVNEDGREKEDVIIGGYDVDAMAVTQDFDLIVRMIKEFYETGDISPELLK